MFPFIFGDWLGQMFAALWQYPHVQAVSHHCPPDSDILKIRKDPSSIHFL